MPDDLKARLREEAAELRTDEGHPRLVMPSAIHRVAGLLEEAADRIEGWEESCA